MREKEPIIYWARYMPWKQDTVEEITVGNIGNDPDYKCVGGEDKWHLIAKP